VRAGPPSATREEGLLMTRLVFVLLIGVLLAAVHAPPPVASGILHPCSTKAWVDGTGPYTVIACPIGDGERLVDVGARITVRVSDPTGAGIRNIIASDIWLIGCSDALALCGGSGSIDADSATNALGMTTISGEIAAGGCDDEVVAVVQGTVLTDPLDCWSNYACLPIKVISVDYNADLRVNLVDFSIFGPAFPSPPQAYDACLDYNGDGVINLVDFSIFGGHFLHQC